MHDSFLRFHLLYLVLRSTYHRQSRLAVRARSCCNTMQLVSRLSQLLATHCNTLLQHTANLLPLLLLFQLSCSALLLQHLELMLLARALSVLQSCVLQSWGSCSLALSYHSCSSQLGERGETVLKCLALCSCAKWSTRNKALCFIVRVLLWTRRRLRSFAAPCYSVLQSCAVCCSLMQNVAVLCSVLQSCAVCCSLVQCVAVLCSVLQSCAVCL